MSLHFFDVFQMYFRPCHFGKFESHYDFFSNVGQILILLQFNFFHNQHVLNVNLFMLYLNLSLEFHE
jgi:hypothetical protein